MSSSFGAFCAKTRADYEEWIGLVKDKAFQAGVPLRAELMSLVYDFGDELSHEAEAESMGFNAGRIHPDIYMNELLVGMRVIHQVLPTILNSASCRLLSSMRCVLNFLISWASTCWAMR